VADERLYPIRDHGGDFFTGVCGDGRQVVMGLLCPEVVAVFFDAAGNHLGCESRFWGEEAAGLAGREPIYDIFGDRFCALIARQLKDWQGELAFRTATIRVKEFWAAGQSVGIEEMPGHYRDIESADWFPNEAERQGFRESRDRWLADGSFVFWWAKDYYMSKDGEVEST